jgi:hypothetical protein
MYDNDACGCGHRGRRRARLRRADLLAAALALIGLLATACGGGSSPARAGGPSHVQAALAYARCMRAHGVPNFSDPQTSNGGIGQPGGMGFDLGGINPNSPQFQSANRACGSIAAHAKGGKS